MRLQLGLITGMCGRCFGINFGVQLRGHLVVYQTHNFLHFKTNRVSKLQVSPHDWQSISDWPAEALDA